MAENLNRELARLARAVKSRRLAAADLGTLALHLRRALAHPALGADLRRALTSLHASAADLHRLSRSPSHAVIDDPTLARMPPSLRDRLHRRLLRLPATLARAAGSSPDPAFRCIEDLERCRARGEGSVVWCHIAAAVCLLRALLPALTSRGR